MSKLYNFLTLFLISYTLVGQYNYIPTNIDTIDVTDYRRFTVETNTRSYWKYQKSREELYVGITIAGMSGLAFYFDTKGVGPFRAFGYTYGAISVAKITSAAIWYKREKREWQNIR